MQQKLYDSKSLTVRLLISRATLWRWVASGRFPKAFKIGQNRTVWDAAEVDAWLEAQKAGR